jgi:hypothetical protein
VFVVGALTHILILRSCRAGCPFRAEPQISLHPTYIGMYSISKHHVHPTNRFSSVLCLLA